MILKESEEYSFNEDIQESGGAEYFQRGNNHVQSMIDTLISKTFVFYVGLQRGNYHAAWQTDHELTSPDDFKSPKEGNSYHAGDYEYAIINKSGTNKPYDILV